MFSKLQLMSGVHRAVYFGSSFVFDFVLVVSSIGIMVATLLIYNPLESFTAFSDTWREYGNANSIGKSLAPSSSWRIFLISFARLSEAVLSLLLLYGYAMIPTSYLLAYVFDKPSTGFMYLLVFNVITGEFDPFRLDPVLASISLALGFEGPRDDL